VQDESDRVREPENRITIDRVIQSPSQDIRGFVRQLDLNRPPEPASQGMLHPLPLKLTASFICFHGFTQLRLSRIAYRRDRKARETGLLARI
jgi:hypothetical protein